MTDQIQEPTPEMPPLDQRQIAMIRFNEHCAIMVKVLNTTPINPTLRSYANMNFDQFAYWFREGIRHMQITPPTPVPPPQSPTECALTDEPVANPDATQDAEPTSSTES